MQSFDRGYYLLVKAIQELRERKDGLVVTVGIGGPTGSGKTRSSTTTTPRAQPFDATSFVCQGAD
jgi:pantothenate kinase-related protein Tda10